MPFKLLLVELHLLALGGGCRSFFEAAGGFHHIWSN